MSRRHLLLCLRLNSPQISRLKIPTGAPSDFHAGEKEKRDEGLDEWTAEIIYALHKYAEITWFAQICNIIYRVHGQGYAHGQDEEASYCNYAIWPGRARASNNVQLAIQLFGAIIKQIGSSSRLPMIEEQATWCQAHSSVGFFCFAAYQTLISCWNGVKT